MQSKMFLFALWEGGGNVPPTLGLARQLVQRGHKVLVISDPCNEPEVRAAGCTFFSYTRAPHRYSKSADTTLLNDYEGSNPVRGLKIFLDKLACGPALEYAKDILDILDTHPVDVVVVSEVLFGGCFAAEVKKLPCVMIIAGTITLPVPDMPPPGMMPKKGIARWMLNKISGIMFKKLMGHGLPAFNKARIALGLNAINDMHDYIYNHLHRILVLTSPDFEFPARFPNNVRITGPVLDDPFLAESKDNPWTETEVQKLILVSLSTTYQQQENLLQNIIDAIGQTPYKAIVTLGPALQKHFTHVPPNVVIRSFIPHSQILPKAAAVITHAGHGTVIRSLAFGVPLICIPIGRDQPANAARVVYHGAGLQLNKNATPKQIANAIYKLIENPDYKNKAEELSHIIREQSRWQKACEEMEAAVSITAVKSESSMKAGMSGIANP